MDTLSFLWTNKRFLAFGLMCTLASNFGQTFFIALFGDQFRAEFALSHGDFGAVYGLATLASAAVILWAGKLVDRVDLRLFAGAVFLGLAASAGLLTVANHVALMGVAFVGLRLFGQGLLRHTAVVSQARYFEAARGRAMSVVGLGYPIAEATFPALVVLVLAAHSWRDAWGGIALYVLVLHLPVAMWMLRGHGERHAELERRLKDAEAKSGKVEEPLTQRRILADWRFQLIVPAALMPPFMMTGLFFHQLAIAGAKGWDIALL
ncbi:MAG: MFS transporter, partial [Alphaproteobacteria bacterium]|nr:MFS transporter [Alphaproteobacteria bacterium]